jgi:hypothetical protein
MKTRLDLCDWIVEALNELGGSAQIKRVCKLIWEKHDKEIIDSGNFHFTWQEDVFWAATQLRAKGVLKNAKATSKNGWALQNLSDESSSH